ncbi:MAG TPA: ABC transporter permease [Thermoanaerobaculia bacterium]|nr:ABC transporter permease [Thermoanaerobaculia bacterium]
MNPAGRLRRLLRSRILGPSIMDQVEAELDLHIELLVRELVEAGVPERQARAEAAERFRDRDGVVATCRRIARGTERRLRWVVAVDELRQDVAYGLRQLARAPSFTAVALLMLAVGLGATTAIWSVVEGVVLRRFPFAHPERVVLALESWQGSGSDFSVGNFVDLSAASRSFVAFAAVQFSTLNLAEGDQPERVLAARASSGFFAVFGVPPLLGRTFSVEEDQPGNDQVVVLSHGLWASHFAADPSILGRSLHLSGRAYRVVGVMPAAFDPTLSQEELWLPIAFTPDQVAQHDNHYLDVVGLLRPGTSLAAAQAELTVAMQRLVERYPQGNMGRSGIRLEPLGVRLIGAYRQRLFVLLGAVGLVLLIACANVASLLLARGSARARELAIRSAIGAGGWRIVRQLLTESAVLALAAGTLGVGLAALAVRLLVRLAPPGIPRVGEIRIDSGVLVFALAVAIACSLLFGTVPAMRAARQDPQSLLRGGAAGPEPVGDRLRSWLVLVEIALALTLLVGAGLLIRSAAHLQRVPTGFDTADLLAARLTLPEAVYPRPETVQQTFDRLVERLAHEPGVRAAAAVSAAPLGPGGGSNGMFAEGKSPTADNLISAQLHIVTPGYLATLRIPLLRGRPFSETDVAGRERVIIVSRELARRIWGGGEPLGKRIACCEGTMDHPVFKTVVGVVGDVRSQGPASEVLPEFYLPIGQTPKEAWTWIQRTMTLVARGSDPRALAGVMRAAVHEVDPALPVSAMKSMEEALHGSTVEARFHTLLLLGLGLLGLLLAAVGIYGMIAYFVSLRTREIGIRVALGATRERILVLLARKGAPPLAGGLLLGSAAALGATRWLEGSLYGVTPTDPLTFAAVIGVLLLTGVSAILIPARRAARIEPTRAIQEP